MTSASSSPDNQFVRWFRDSSPYIHAHRNRTFVIFFSGEVINEKLDTLVHDFALLKSLGIRLVLVHGIRPQIDRYLKQNNIQPRYHHNLRITDEKTLPFVKQAAGLLQLEISALLSMGVANSPMAGAKIRVISGNYVTAKPLGIIDGIDYCHTGLVRRIDHHAICQQLDQNNIVLISPIGFSPTGEVFNLAAEQVATEVAIALNAEKLILLTEHDCLSENRRIIRQMTTREAKALLEQTNTLPQAIAHSLEAAIKGCQHGVERVHLINRHTDGALLLELFSRDGIGTLVSASPFEEIRHATLEDIGGILELIKPLEERGILVKRSREKLETDINDYIVIERDGLIIGCTALHCLDQNAAEIACLAVHPDYRRNHRGEHLLNFLVKKARKKKLRKLYALSSQTMHWFIERGFKPVTLAELPPAMKSFYNKDRNSKVLCKDLSSC
ncbi:amino-acid N-acetyltransferase [methane-oxidizing endosymbiont of Gigantopelta aegis]|uniref:amino-acid N-acetyltransferase n=1 Tax=methane-oxidizing endosymbiont of Gigantopelta aegis TaxID=2794938 RepID=UPI0018DE6C71|nr:amino-acid N-acetyltransferase [methane-oxidizing endosymbiont of Gigantopelta aegis]